MESTNKVAIHGRIIPDSKKLHQNQEVYCINGIAATLKATNYKDPPKILLSVERDKW